MANILIDVGHPAHVHVFQNAASSWQASGYKVHFSALDREMILTLLERYQLPYDITYSRQGKNKNLLRELPPRTWQTFQIARAHQTDLFVSMANPVVGLVARLMAKPYLAMGDTEPSYNQLAASMPFVTRLLTPDVFYRDAGRKHERYASYHELAYLHPQNYVPDPSIFEAIGLERGAPYSVLRFVAWDAMHDMYESGFNREERRAVVDALRAEGSVIVSSEGAIPDEFTDLIIDYPQDRMHDLLAFAQVYVGEGNTMASEAAVLGTPAIRVNSMDMGYCRDLQERGLMFQLLSGSQILAKLTSIFAEDDPKAPFRAKRELLLRDKVATTDVILEHADNLLKASR